MEWDWIGCRPVREVEGERGNGAVRKKMVKVLAVGEGNDMFSERFGKWGWWWKRGNENAEKKF